MHRYNWKNTCELDSQSYTCGYCGEKISSNEGYYTENIGIGFIYICHNCGKPTFIDCYNNKKQYPGSLYGESFKSEIFGNDNDVDDLYDEVRRCFSIGAYTAVGLCCRKLLMHIAVSLGAEENKNFAYYVDYLNNQHYIPTNAKGWVDVIRAKGNDATHKIISLTKEDAEQLIDFTQMIINVIYKMPYDLNKYVVDNR